MEFRDVFLNVEKEYLANSLEVNGFRYWIHSRFFIYSEFEKKINEYGSAYDSLPTSKKIICYLKRLVSIFQHFFKRRILWNKYKKRDVILVKCHPRRKLIDDKYVSIYTDMLLDGLDNVITYEETDYYTHNVPCYTKEIVYLDGVEIFGIAHYFADKYIMRKRILRIEEQIKKDLFPILDDICSKCNVMVNYNSILKKVMVLYYLSKSSSKYWNKEFKKYRVRGVVTVAHYSHYCFELTKAAHDNGIPVIELQHGTIIKSHIAYQYKDNYAKDYMPDYIYTFSEFWSKELSVDDLNIGIVPIGFEFFNVQKEKSLQKTSCDNKNVILILSAKNISDKLRKIALKIADEIQNKQYDFRLIYKLHPYEFHSAEIEYKELYENDNITIVKDEPELYSLFAQSMLQIGNNSTALFEGMGFGIQTCFIRNEDELLNRMVEEKYAVFIDENTDFAKLLENAQNEHLTVGEINLWQDNAKHNFLNEMTEIFGERKL